MSLSSQGMSTVTSSRAIWPGNPFVTVETLGYHRCAFIGQVRV